MPVPASIPARAHNSVTSSRHCRRMSFVGEHNNFRAAILRDPHQSPIVTGKKSRGDRSAQSLTGKSVPRTETRCSDMRGGDRHRLSDAEAIVRKGRRNYRVDLINISGGGAM